MQTKFRIRSNAKINLALRITGRLDNGYHTISTLFQEIDFCDLLEFEKAENFSFSSNKAELSANHSNLCVQAYDKMKPFRRVEQEYALHLIKRIPMGAGLGGGSSNAAEVLKFLNKQWKIGFSDEKLEAIGLELGCDVPFFIKGGTQGGDNLGEKLTPLDFPTDYSVLLVHPGIHISTVWAYQNFSLTDKKNRYKFPSLLNGNKIQWQLFENVFENVVFQSYPEIGKIKERLIEKGAVYSGLSGSGSTMVGVFDDKESIDNAKLSFESYPTFISLPIR
jgi:4-diphosphocytidyl-2-C-methyl-D-erythritol kinase